MRAQVCLGRFLFKVTDRLIQMRKSMFHRERPEKEYE